MPNINERLLYDDSISAFYPSEAFPVIPALDSYELPFTNTYKQINAYRLTVPSANGTTGYCQMYMPWVCYQDPTNTTYFQVNTANDGSGTTFTAKVGNVTLGEYDVRVYPGQHWVDFHANRAGEYVYVWIRAGHTNFDAGLVRRFSKELNAVSQAVIDINNAGEQGYLQKTYTAGSTLTAPIFCRLHYNLTLELAGCSNISLRPAGLILNNVNAGATEPLITSGIVEGAFTGLIDGQPVYIKNDSGEWTQDLADVANTNYVMQVGHAIGETNMQIDCGNPHIIKKVNL